MRSASSRLQSVAATGLRAVLGLGLAMLILTTIWICLIAGVVIVVTPHLGLGGALLSVAGGLSGLVLTVILLLILVNRQEEPPPRESSGTRDEAIALALRLLQRPGARRIAFGAAGIILLAAAVMMSGSDDPPPSD